MNTSHESPEFEGYLHFVHQGHPDWVPMQTGDASLEGTGEVPLCRTVRGLLRMPPPDSWSWRISREKT